MNASESIKYIASLSECPYIFRKDSAKIKSFREWIICQNTLSDNQKECCLDLLDSATILTDMLIPFQYVVGLMTKYRGIELFNFNHIFNSEPISSLDLYKFLICQNEADRKRIINRLTPNDENRGLLNLSLESEKPQLFLSVFAKSHVNKNILMGLYALNYALNFSLQSLDEIESDQYSAETIIRLLFSQYEQMFHDLANIPADEGVDILIEPIVSILENANFEGEHFEEDIAKIIKIRNRLNPITLRKVCLYITYYYVLGFYMAFDQHQFTNAELNAISQILNRNQYKNYGVIIRRKCRMMLAKVDEYNKKNLKVNSLRNRCPELWKALEKSAPFIDISIEHDKKDSIQTEFFGANLIDTDLRKLQTCINVLASLDYISNDIKTKRLLYYRLTGFARPSVIEKIAWHKDIKVLFLLIKTIYEKSKGKFDNISNFFTTTGYQDSMIGRESAYASRVKDKVVVELMNHLYDNSK